MTIVDLGHVFLPHFCVPFSGSQEGLGEEAGGGGRLTADGHRGFSFEGDQRFWADRVLWLHNSANILNLHF